MHHQHHDVYEKGQSNREKHFPLSTTNNILIILEMYTSLVMSTRMASCSRVDDKAGACWGKPDKITVNCLPKKLKHCNKPMIKFHLNILR